MTTNTLEDSAKSRTGPRATRAEERSKRQIEESLQSSEAAVVELVHGSVNAVQAFLPAAVTRPTQAVDYVFDLAEQVLAMTRKAAYEVASLVESGVQGVERRAA
jgi:hypothetical protein